MRCPHCNIHYMDDEKVCPICGKRAGSSISRKKQTNAARPISQPAAKSSPKKPKAAGSSSGWNSPPSSKSNPTLKKKTSGGCGCFLIVIILLSVVMLSGLLNVYSSDGLLDSLPSDILDRFEDYGSYDFDDSFDDDTFVYSYDQPVECMVGTWAHEGTGDLLTVHDDGAVTITSDGASYTAQPDDSFFRVLDIDEDNAEDYLESWNDERIDDYPPEEYYYCELSVYPTDDDGTLLYEQTLNLLVFLPRDLYDSAEPAEAGTILDAFDHQAEDTEKSSPVSYVMQPTE